MGLFHQFTLVHIKQYVDNHMQIMTMMDFINFKHQIFGELNNFCQIQISVLDISNESQTWHGGTTYGFTF